MGFHAFCPVLDTNKVCDAVEVFLPFMQNSGCSRLSAMEQNASRRKETLFDNRVRRVTWIESLEPRRMGLFILKSLVSAHEWVE
jgi:hypothetical protein